MKRRVVITGMGVLSPIGNTIDELWNSIIEGKCGISQITNFDTTNFKVKLAGEIKNLDESKYFEPRKLKFDDQFTKYARIAAKMAMDDAAFKEIDNDRAGVILGSGIGGIGTIENSATTLLEKGPRKISPYFIPKSLINLAAGAVAIDHNINGTVESVVTACAASTNAIGDSFRNIRDGYLDVVITGGSEASVTPLAVGGFQSMRALYTGDDINNASIPFDLNRSGFVMGEGAGILVLEELEHALARNAKIYGEVIGYGTSCDANHITSPLKDGSIVAKAMINAVKDADINISDIDYLNVHGTSTKLNDLTESNAIRLVFGEDSQLNISSTKSYTGHLLGATGGVEAIISTLALKHSIIPPTINLKELDPECYPNVTKLKHENIKIVMSNSLGFGGHNASIIIKKWEV
jgi:3-oxoacyl-[acyl-carrier-protein] synthase II